jgi:polyphosphate kinase 2 (PPK2 family)
LRREDLENRERRGDYIAAYEDVLTETSTDWAPWYVVPADDNWVRNLAVAELWSTLCTCSILSYPRSTPS